MSSETTTGTTGLDAPRVRQIAALPGHDDVAATVDKLVAMSLRALPHMYRPQSQEFVQTVRADPGSPDGLSQEGVNQRYAAIVALGTAHVDEAAQRGVLADRDTEQFTATLTARGLVDQNQGAIALSAWAGAEVLGRADERLFTRLVEEVKSASAQPVVDYSWTLTALLAAHRLADTTAIAEQALERLLAAQGAKGIFPHRMPRETLGRYRAHIGCFADQVYPIQALARYYAVTADRRALDAANRCAGRIVELQGPAGQWWWHYDVRTGDVVEGYPVYSVHQHAMAPMALFELAEAGGDDHGNAIADGLSWLEHHPEPGGELLDERTGVIWRKIGRRERKKAVRSLRALSTSVSPRLHLGALDKLFPPGVIDHECRPYELGWLLYAWRSAGVVAALRPSTSRPNEPGEAG